MMIYFVRTNKKKQEKTTYFVHNCAKKQKIYHFKKQLIFLPVNFCCYYVATKIEDLELGRWHRNFQQQQLHHTYIIIILFYMYILWDRIRIRKLMFVHTHHHAKNTEGLLYNNNIEKLPWCGGDDEDQGISWSRTNIKKRFRCCCYC